MTLPNSVADGTAEEPSDLYRRVTAWLTELGYHPSSREQFGTLWRKPEPRDSRNYTVGVYYGLRPDGMDWESVSDRIAWLEGIPADTVRARCGTDTEREEWLARRVAQLNDEIRTVMPGQATIITIQARIAQRMATRDDNAGSNPPAPDYQAVRITPHEDGTVHLVACTRCGVFVWDCDQHERTQHRPRCCAGGPQFGHAWTCPTLP